MEQILTKRLLEFLPASMEWGEHHITLKDIEEGLKKGLPVIEEMFAAYSGFVTDFKTKEWHIGRILYFIKNPDKIDAISIDNHCMDGYILPFPAIVDGNHRFLSQVFMDYLYINAEYGGREDVLEYLTGVSDEMPLD